MADLLNDILSSKKPNRLIWGLEPETILALADALILKIRADYDQIAAVTNPTYENVLAAMANSEAQCDVVENICRSIVYDMRH
jgi:hypothetical protein